MRTASSALIPAVSAVAARLSACSGSDKPVLPARGRYERLRSGLRPGRPRAFDPRLQLTLVACDGMAIGCPSPRRTLTWCRPMTRFASWRRCAPPRGRRREAEQDLRAGARPPPRKIRHRPLPTTTGWATGPRADDATSSRSGLPSRALRGSVPPRLRRSGLGRAPVEQRTGFRQTLIRQCRFRCPHHHSAGPPGCGWPRWQSTRTR